MNKEFLKREFLQTHITSTKNYYQVLTDILEERTGTALNVHVKCMPRKDIVTFTKGDQVVSRLTCTPDHHIRHRSLTAQVNGASKELASLIRATRGKGVC